MSRGLETVEISYSADYAAAQEIKTGFFTSAVIGNKEGKVKRIAATIRKALNRYSVASYFFFKQLSIRSVAYLLPRCYPSLLTLFLV